MEYGLVVFLLLAVVFSLAFSRFSPALIFSAVVAVLLVSGILPLESIANNYVNPSLLTLVVLVLLAVALEKTLLLTRVVRYIVKGGLKSVLFRLCLFTGLSSALLNNTAIVAALMGPLRKQSGLLASKVLLPLSYASILGGMLTLIGTSTNLIVNGFIDQAGFEPFSFFDFTFVGGLVFIASGVCLIFVSSRSLPEHLVKDQHETLEYFLERKVSKHSELIGRSVADNGLRRLEKLFLVDIVRNGRVLSPVGPEEIVREGDVLVFSGDPSAISLLEPFHGLVASDKEDSVVRSNLMEVVVSPSSSLLGHTIKEADFRARFDAAVVAVRRGESRIRGGLGKLRLRAGDGLVLSVGTDFKGRANLSRNFILLGDLTAQKMLHPLLDAASIIAFLAVIASAVLGWIPFFNGILLLLFAYLVSGLVRVGELRRRFPFELIMVVGGALGLAQAMIETHVAADMAAFINSFDGYGVVGSYVGIFLVTWFLTELVTNNAAAALVFPIALAVAQQWGVSPYPFFMAVAFGASASFLSPYGYQTNLMVFSVGRYRLSDYLRAGLPVLVVYSITALITIPMVFPF